MGRDQRSGASGRTITKRETKLCPLCGALNHRLNSECFICGWHGGFDQDAAAIDYRWQCLVEKYEEVRLEHLTARGVRVIDDFGVVRKSSPWQRLLASCRQRWQTFLVRREARAVAREALSGSQTTTRHR